MRIGILTSGGDCPGINATIRGVCKTAISHYGMEVYGIHSGFRGLLDNDITPLTEKDLTGLLNMGGTILGTSREKPFKKRSATSQNKPALMLKTIKEMQLDDKVYSATAIASRISLAKNNLITAERYNAKREIIIEDTAAKRPLVGEIYKKYSEQCKKSNVMDFDDLLLNMNILFHL